MVNYEEARVAPMEQVWMQDSQPMMSLRSQPPVCCA